MSKDKKKKDCTSSECENTAAEEITEAEEVAPASQEDAPSQAEEKSGEAIALEELEKQKEMYLRLMAEYDNYRKRTASEKLSIYADATAKAVSELLPLADSVIAAVNAVGSEGDAKGIELISNQLFTCFEKLGVTAFGEVGEAFNPEFHNAVSMMENPELEKNTLGAVFQKGFKLGDKVIRPAMVVVANCN